MQTEPDSDELGYAVADGVAVLTIHRPDRMNAWTPQLETQLRQRIAQAEADVQVRCIVLTGAGRAFCAGMDMAVLQARSADAQGAAVGADAGDPSDADADAAQRYGYLGYVDKPLIAAINGAASGVGLCLTLHCDLRYVVPGAKLSFPYARRGLVAEHGTAWLLPRLIGPMQAAELLITGRTFTGDEAERMGLAQCLPAEDFMSDVLTRAREIAAATSPRAVRLIKQQLREARYQTLGEATRIADREIAACRGTEDFQEGVRHFVEKRAPRFTGR
ncbi:enoyl-CoA hydratase-related protein [Pseudacidovorax sp. RU35E]|uniref:enoyl-CoA hydratase-related protein n=1 Tax=Pseudacidovorax sp. RU35E TaxID=1907403 RepID=UPI000955A272|nr:enoyl-CoA hydratase-related protein [Pseudacidovorax sp. RU35E]SIP90991.1 Enoyl-CoA hydratase/carnithine racemase [Pseudacidovorax sp. RU35E]